MILKIDCIFNNYGAWCKCKKVKRKWYEIGGRGCMEYSNNPIVCKFKEHISIRPKPPLPMQK